jgi:replicative DNA helicase
MSARDMPDSAPHYNPQLERDALGQMLSSGGTFDAYVATGLQRADFFKAAHQQVFDGIAAVEGRGIRADVVTVGLELRKQGTFEAVGAGYFVGLTDGHVRPTPEAVQFIAGELAELAGRRELLAALERGTVADVAEKADRAVTRTVDQRRAYDAPGQLESLRVDTVRDDAGRLWLGLPTLDNILEGLRPGEVFGLMARPGIGKTLVLGHITRAVAETAFGHVFFSLEMPAAQIVDRIAGAHFGMNRHALRDRLKGGALDVADYERTFARFVLVDAPGLSIADMSAKLRQIQASTLRNVPLRLVTVDHLGLVGGDRKMNTYDRVSTQARELKELAKRFNVTVLLAVQVNREAGGDGSKELGLGSARDSGVVEEAMDYLVAMRRLDRSQTLSAFEREKYRDVLFAKVVKNRHGSPDTEIAIRFDARTLQLSEDPSLVIEESALGRIAATAGRGRR